MTKLRPLVISEGKTREGRGFSQAELKKASLTKQRAKKLDIPFDKRRRSSKPENVAKLKTFLKGIKPVKVKKKKAKKAKK